MRLPLLLPLALTASLLGCAAPGATPSPTASASTGPQATASTAPAASPAAATGGAVMGAFSLSVDGVDFLVDTAQFKFTPTDLLGKRSRFGLSVGGVAEPKEGEGSVTFLVGEASGVYPRFSLTEKPATVFSVKVSVYPKGGSLKGYQLTTNTSGLKEKTVTAENGRVQGVLDAEVAREVTTLGGDPPPRERVRLSFDFTQAPMAP